MAYGRKRTYAPRRGLSRSTGRRFGKSKYASSRKRVARVSKARLASSKRTRVRTIARNTRAIKRIKTEMYGPVQRNTLTVANSVPVHATRPILLELQNFEAGSARGSRVYTTNGVLSDEVGEAANGYAVLYEGPLHTSTETSQVDDDHRQNGPICKWISTRVRIRVRGAVSDTRVRVTVLRHKRAFPTWWEDSDKEQYLPHTLPNFKNLAGFTPNYIDKKDFHVITEKYMYLNSDAYSTPFDLTAGDETTQESTAMSRMCSINLRMNKVLKQLKPSINERTGEEIDDIDRQDEQVGDREGTYRYNNLDPRASIWLLISCDDKRDVSEWVPGKENTVMCEIIRDNVWRDSRG